MPAPPAPSPVMPLGVVQIVSPATLIPIHTLLLGAVVAFRTRRIDRPSLPFFEDDVDAVVGFCE